MKDFFDDFKNKDTLFIIFISLLLGVFIGVFFKSGYSLGIKSFFRDVYFKINPESQKDSKTIILEKADCYELPNTIFDETKKKDNKFILFIKNLKKEKPQTIKNFDSKH